MCRSIRHATLESYRSASEYGHVQSQGIEHPDDAAPGRRLRDAERKRRSHDPIADGGFLAERVHRPTHPDANADPDADADGHAGVHAHADADADAHTHANTPAPDDDRPGLFLPR